VFFYTNVFPRGDKIYFRGFKDGKRISQHVDFKPTLFVRSKKESKFKSIFGENLDRIQFPSITEARDFVKKYKEVSNFPIYGNTNFVYQLISKLFPDTISFDPSLLKILTVDIETTVDYGFPDTREAQEEVLLITVRDFKTKQMTTYGCKPFLPKKSYCTYIQCKDEMDLLRRFIESFKTDGYPDIITGWNSQLFDVAYLSSRIRRVLGEKALQDLSPHGFVLESEVEFARGRTQVAFNWAGISILDYMDLYKKFSFKQLESYRLDAVAKEELDKEKLKHPYNSFKEFYSNDWNLFVDYNIVDVELVDELEDKMKLIELILTMAYDAKCNYTDIYSSVRTWDCILYNALLKRDIVVHNPPGVDPEKDRQIMGAFVKDPVPGQYDWVVSFDATSLYPSIIMSWNMSPETLVSGQKYLADDDRSIQKLIDREFDTTTLHEEAVTMTANGQCFRKDRKGIFPELVEFYFAGRQKAKKAMLEAQSNYEKTKDPKHLGEISSLNSKQMAAKILMNSLYGAMGNIYFRYYDIRIAEGITMTGQLIIRTVAKQLNKLIGNEVGKATGSVPDKDFSFYSDTDSTYITLNEVVKAIIPNKGSKEIVEVLDKYCAKVIEPVISKTCGELCSYLNTFQDRIKFKREVIAERGIWIAKKRYALTVHNAEGVVYDPPKLKVLGMEIVRTSTPAPVRKALKEAVEIVLTKDENTIKQYVSDVEKKWHNLNPESIAFPRGVNGVKDYSDSNSIFKKGTPIHVRGSLIYNHMIKNLGLEKQYQYIQEGDKIKFIYLKEPNPLGTHVISFIGDLPLEFRLQSYIDYDKMFEKAFLDPLNSLLSCIGWQLKEQATLEGLFG
jgi:DNA polymerase elongation subunit (family B)